MVPASFLECSPEMSVPTAHLHPPSRIALVLAATIVSMGGAACGDGTVVGGGGGAAGTGSGGAGAAGTGSGGAGPDLTSLPVCVPDGQPEPEPPHTDITGAVYSVPVPASLEPYASYPIGDVSLCRTAGGIELGYSLPALLVGKKTRVSFAGGFDPTTGTYELSSEDGTASCDPGTGSWSCLERFVGLEIDLTEVAAEAAALGPQEAAARLEVAQLFSGDPIGVLDFDLP